MRISRYYLLVTFLSLLPFVSIFSTSLFPHTHDGLVHLARMGAYFKALGDGQFPVRWAGDLNYGYGMPLFDFIYPLPYWVSSVFLFLGLGLVLSFKLVLLISFLLSGIFMFAFAKNLFEDLKKAFLVTIFYQFSSFRLIELLVRGDIGEIYTYAFFPAVLLGLTTLIFKKANFKSFFLTGLATAFLILSHNSISLVFFLTSFLFILFFAKKRKEVILGTSAMSIGLLFSAFYWLPALLDHKYTLGNLFMKNVYLEHFVPIQNFFIPNFTNNVSLQTEGISVQFGLLQITALFLSAVLLLSRQKLDFLTKRLILFCLFLIFVSVFFMQPISTTVWANISILRQFQFPWRFLAVVSFATSLISVSFFSYSFFQKKIVFTLLCILIIVSSIYYWRPALGFFDKVDEKYYWNFPLTTTYYGETDLIWSAGPAKVYPKSRVEVIGGQAAVSNFTKKSNSQSFIVEAQTDAQLVDHTQYFPGWKVYVDKIPAEIQFQDQHWRGEIVFEVPKGKHSTRVVFEETKLRLLSDLVSLTSFLGILFFWILKTRKAI